MGTGVEDRIEEIVQRQRVEQEGSGMKSVRSSGRGVALATKSSVSRGSLGHAREGDDVAARLRQRDVAAVAQRRLATAQRAQRRDERLALGVPRRRRRQRAAIVGVAGGVHADLVAVVDHRHARDRRRRARARGGCARASSSSAVARRGVSCEPTSDHELMQRARVAFGGEPIERVLELASAGADDEASASASARSQ